MKHLLIIFSSILIATLIGCGSADAKTEVSVSTIQCGMCQKTIEKGLGTLKGVKSVHVSMEDKVAHVVHDPNVANPYKCHDTSSGDKPPETSIR